jgi:hypothetical protein
MSVDHSRLHPRWRPSERELAGAGVIVNWQVLVRAAGSYRITGNIAGRPSLASLQAMDAVAGWALANSRLLVLGKHAPGVCVALSPQEVMRRAAEPTDERSAIRAEIAALAGRARSVGMPILAYLLDVADIEAANAEFPKRVGPKGRS